MKRLGIILSTILSVIVLSACGKSVQLTDYVEISFSGLDGYGRATYDLKMDEVFEDLFDFNPDVDFPDENMKAEMDTIHESYKMKIDQEEGLSNGDKVTVTIAVDDQKTKKIKGGEKEFTVEGLEIPEQLTTKDVEEHLVIDFIGPSGRGFARIENKFTNEIKDFHFTVENNGFLNNGEQANIILDEDEEDRLLDFGYVLEENFQPTVQVNSLDKVPEQASEIENLNDLKRMIEEEVKRRYRDWYPDISLGERYEIQHETFMYRQFRHDLEDELQYNNISDIQHGYFAGIYSIEKYRGGEDGELKEAFTAIIGFKNLILDENNQVNVAKIENFHEKKDDTYSLDTIFQLYEGEGYEILEEED